MELIKKLEILADAAKYDASCASSGSRRKRPANGLGNTEGMGICHSYAPDGRCISLLKLLLTNVCIWDCAYCVNRRSSDTRRARFTPDEVVRLTVGFYKRNYIEGLFLSSGIIRNADYTMELLIEVARKLRSDESFGGYIHLKAVPGASPELLKRAGLYADRLSANIEMPTQEDLDLLAPEKKVSDIETTMSHIKRQIIEDQDKGGTLRTPPALQAGQSTQIVVGATKTSDAVILKKADYLYKSFDLRRVYYSAYSPVNLSDPRLSPVMIPQLREHRLYQADWLLRFYGFGVDEILDGGSGNLQLDKDPKLAWALRHRDFFPLDVNVASREQLLRVPGLGAKNVSRILSIRRFQRLRLADLYKLRVQMSRAKYFLLAADSNPGAALLDKEDLFSGFRHPIQPTLFDLSPHSTVTGEL